MKPVATENPASPAKDEPTATEPNRTGTTVPSASEPVSDAKDEAVAQAGGLSDMERQKATELYTAHCAACHGEKGNGVSVASRFLSPRPRNFRAGGFRLVSTENAVPSVQDFEKVLVRGMPGSAMPPWPHFTNVERRLLADFVLEFRREEIRDMERKSAAEENEAVDVEQMEEVVRTLTTPGEVVPVPEIGQPTPEAIARGKQLFLASCASCHGKEGRGDGQQKMVDAEGLPTRPRDLTKGIFKGNTDLQSIYRLFLTGMPGTPMPALRQNTPEQLADLAHFVLSLSDEKMRGQLVLNRERIVVRQVPTLPDSPDSPVWQDLMPASLRTTPLWWRDEYTSRIDVRAVHDGKSIALNLSWADATDDNHTGKTESFRDAVAVELFHGEIEPFLGMGSPKAAVDVWHWGAGQNRPHDLENENPNVVADIYPFSEQVVSTAEYQREGTRTDKQPPLSLPAVASGNQNVPGSPVRFGSAIETSGPGTVTFLPAVNQSVKTLGIWKEGRWNVILSRAVLTSGGPDGISLEAGQRVSAAFAIWDGSKRDRGPQKVVTIWQDLVLERP